MRCITSSAIALIFLIACIHSQAQPKETSVVDTIKQLELDMGKAMMAGDIDRLSQIYADDWATLGSSGKVTTKQTLLNDFESFHDKLEWFEAGPMDLQVFGDIAIAQGFVKEKRSLKGKDTSGQFLWQDLLQKRAGKWVVWRSAAAKAVLADAPNAQSQDPAIVASIQKFENDIGNAMVASNIDILNQAYADDWATIASSGEILTKERLLRDFKSGNHKLTSFKNGPMDVRVLGDVAVVQASVTENRIADGKSISGKFVYMDLLKKRSGKWVVVRSAGTRLSQPGQI